MRDPGGETFSVTQPELDWWFTQIEELNREQQADAKQRARTPSNRLTGRLFLELVVLPAGLSIVLGLAVWTGIARWLAVVSLYALALSYLGIFAYSVIALWLHRRSAGRLVFNPFAALIDNARTTAEIDRRYLDRFSRETLDSLRFVLMEVRAERTFFERRLGLLVGSIERVGLLPGVLAVVLLVTRLGSGQPDWVYAIAYATPILYIIAAMSHFLLMRLQRVVELLQMIIDRSEYVAEPGQTADADGQRG